MHFRCSFTWSPRDPEPLREQIARQLRDRIVRGELSAGELLPDHRQMARQHRVAPSTFEAAYELLFADGLLTGTPADDVRVAELRPERRRDLVERLQLEKLVAQELGRRELEMARDVQRRLLPPSEVAGPGWEVAARCLPARVVAGDFYDILRHADGRVDVVVADVAGKGFAASLIMASVKAMLPFVNADGGVADLLVRLNGRLALELGRGEFVALAVARYSPSGRLVELANAGAPDPYLMRPGQPPQPLSVPGPRLPLGVREEVAYASRTVEVTADDRHSPAHRRSARGSRRRRGAAGIPGPGVDARPRTPDRIALFMASRALRRGPAAHQVACRRTTGLRRCWCRVTPKGDTVILNLSELSDEPLHAQISRQIRAKILSQDLAGDDALPSIRGLAKEQRVSVITVQRAYEDLEREGLVRSRRGKGFWVAPIPEGRKQTMAKERFADANWRSSWRTPPRRD